MLVPETISATDNERIPDVSAAVRMTRGSETRIPIHDGIIDGFGEGTLDESRERPVENTPLPPAQTLSETIGRVQEYLGLFGCKVVADAHLQGMAAPVTVTSDGTVYALLDESVFQGIVTRVIEHHDLGSGQSRKKLREAVVLAHAFEFHVQEDPAGTVADSDASWPELTGQQTESPTGIVFSVPHPIRALDCQMDIPERGLALVAGIQRLTADLNTVFGQRDIGMYFLTKYIVGHGSHRVQARTIVKDWYDVSLPCLNAVIGRVSDYLENNGVPADDPKIRYYLTSDAAAELIP
jgi:hypothetical protein